MTPDPNINHKPSALCGGRRQFLKAVGISIALPCMESLGSPLTIEETAPMRMVCISSALGLYPQAFFPKTFGADYQLSPTLQPLEKYRDQFTVFSHMDHPCLLYTSPSPRDQRGSRMPSSA